MTLCKGKPENKCKGSKCKYVKTQKRKYCRSSTRKTKSTKKSIKKLTKKSNKTATKRTIKSLKTFNNSCPMLTKQDKKIASNPNFKSIIKEIQKESHILSDSPLSKCRIQRLQSGGYSGDNEENMTNAKNSRFVDYFSKVLFFIITASITGASVAIFMQYLPYNVQISLLSIVNMKATIAPPCTSWYDYAVGTMGGLLWEDIKCSKRAEMLEQAVTKLLLIFGGTTGLSVAVIREWLNYKLGYTTKKPKDVLINSPKLSNKSPSLPSIDTTTPIIFT